MIQTAEQRPLDHFSMVRRLHGPWNTTVMIQGSMQAQMAVNQAVHFTDWVVAHSHMAMLGFASFAAAGGLVHAWQRIGWARYNARAINHGYWLLVAGLVLMVVDLTVAGLVQGRLWAEAAPWIESVQAWR